MKFQAKSKSLVLAAFTLPMTAMAEGTDFSAITGAIAATAVVGGITAMAAIKVLPPFTRWGYNQVIKFFGS